MNRRSLFKGVLGLGAVAGLSLLPKVAAPEAPETEPVLPVALPPSRDHVPFPGITPYTITVGNAAINFAQLSLNGNTWYIPNYGGNYTTSGTITTNCGIQFGDNS